MIKKYVYGTPFQTEAVLQEIPVTTGDIPYFHQELTDTASLSLSLPLAEKDIVYGLGEQIRGINKRGWQYVSWNLDNPNHSEDTHSLYGSHNFLLVQGETCFGMFLDYPGRITFDIGYTKRDLLHILVETADLDIYIINGESPADIVKQFRGIIGKSYTPPLWAMGYGQSRWGYKDEADIRAVAESYEKAGIPLDSIYMDIDYMQDYKDFTVNEERFPDLKALAAEMQAKGIHLVPIIDAGVKIEEGYDIYEEGVRNNYFCKNKAGEDFVGAVWPGRVHFPDFLNPAAREWFGSKYKALTDLGIDGFWNDMNEPACFYTEDRLAETLSELDRLKTENVGINEFFALTGMVAGLNGNVGDYDKFYHNVNGEMMQHSKLHNLYGMNMTRAAYEALEKLCPDKKTLFFSRSSYIGAHRYGGIWQGDNNSWWSHILQSMQQLPALNMAGFMYVGADTGGFGCDTTEDLMLRFLQYSLFTPLFRNHSALGTRNQELYRFSEVEAMGEMVKIRYSLIPYLYSELLRATSLDEMMFRPLGFDFPEDETAREVEDQLLLGGELMIAPVYRQNASGRYVYLPEEMMMVRMRSHSDYETSILPKGHHYVQVPLRELVFFIRKGKAIPLFAPANCTAKIDDNEITMLGYHDAFYHVFDLS